MKIETTGVDASPERDQPIIAAVIDALEADPRVAGGMAVANYVVPGSEVADCDLLLCLKLREPVAVKPFADAAECTFHNIIFLLELKRHTKCELRDGALYVNYHNAEPDARRKNATKQATDVAASLGWFLKAQGKRFGLVQPWVYGGLYLAHIPFDEAFAHPVVEANTIFKDTLTLNTLLTLAARQKARRAEPAPHRSDGLIIFSSWVRNGESDQYEALRQTLGFFEQARTPAAHDRRRIEVFTKKRIIADAQYLKKLGSQLLIFKGKAGTGKTARLLALARHCSEHGVSCMLITYNHALALDIRRLVTVMSELGEPLELTVRTINQVTYRLAAAMGDSAFQLALKSQYETNFAKGFATALGFLSGLMDGDDSSELRDLALSELPEFDKDYILIDEGQDWHPTEIGLMNWIAGGPHRLIVAIGPDQHTRKYSSDWDSLSTQRQVVPCAMNVRQKPGLHAFNLRLSKALGEEWTESDMVSDAGTVELISDSALNRQSFWDELDERLGVAKPDGNRRADVLIFEPSYLKPGANAAALLSAFDRPVWDGTNSKLRNTTPMLDPDAYRVLYYESARGLESWVAILRLVDVQARNIRKRLEKEANDQNATAADDNAVRMAVLRTLRIAATRPIDALILTFRDEANEIVDLMKRLV